MDDNFGIYEKVVGECQNFSLNAAEITIINKFKKDWHKTSMLDIGIGTGRTVHSLFGILTIRSLPVTNPLIYF